MLHRGLYSSLHAACHHAVHQLVAAPSQLHGMSQAQQACTWPSPALTWPLSYPSPSPPSDPPPPPPQHPFPQRPPSSHHPSSPPPFLPPCRRLPLFRQRAQRGRLPAAGTLLRGGHLQRGGLVPAQRTDARPEPPAASDEGQRGGPLGTEPRVQSPVGQEQQAQGGHTAGQGGQRQCRGCGGGHRGRERRCKWRCGRRAGWRQCCCSRCGCGGVQCL
jgi:hypothetical protein